MFDRRNRSRSDNMIISVSGSPLEICVVRSDRRTLGLEVKNDGSVIARVPARISEASLRRFLLEHENWIRKKKNQLNNRFEAPDEAIETIRDLPPERLRAIRKRICDRVEYWSKVMGVSVNRVSVRAQKSRWGSCSSKGNVNFNYRLGEMPEKLLDYVIVHELAHRRHMNHSEAFWEEVAAYLPDYRERRKKLKQYRIV